MPNPIADPLVENVETGELDGLVRIDTQVRGVATVTINQPQTGNALNGAVALALIEAFETLHGAEHVRVVFVRGAGGTFSSGPDRSWLRTAAEDWSESELRGEAMTIGRMLQTLTAIPALTIAVVEGEAVGAGVGLVAACDLAVAAAHARFSFPEVASGGVAAMAAPFVVNAVGPRQAKALMATGRVFDARHAERIGLVDEVAEAADLDALLERLVEQAMANGPKAVAETKTMVWEVWTQEPDHGLLDKAAHRFARSRLGEEGREGTAALLAGKRPSWAED